MTWPTLRTERLVLRPLAMDDLDALAELHAEESFWRYPFGRGLSRDETEDFLGRGWRCRGSYPRSCRAVEVGR